MFQPVQEDFFQVSLSQEGASHLYRIYKIAGWLFGFAIVLSLVALALIYMRYRIYRSYDTDQNIFHSIELWLYPIYAVLVTVLTIVQFCFFFHFSRLCKKSLDTRQADLFNYSLKWLYRNTVLAYAQLIVQLLVSSYYLYAEYHILQKLN